MDQKTILKLLAVVIVLGILFTLFTNRTSEPSPTVDENLAGNMTDETRAVNDEIADEKPRSIAFEHTNPGVSSEVYYTVGNLDPGSNFKATLYKSPGADIEHSYGMSIEKEVMVDEFGVARFVFEITEFGEYGASDQLWGYDMIMETITVE